MSREEYEVNDILKTANIVSEDIILLKQLFEIMIKINPQCVDITSTYAVAYRYILRDESTFSDLITRI